MPEVEIEETEVNKPNGNPLDDMFASPSSPGMNIFMGGVGEKIDSESCPDGQEWDENAQTCVPIVDVWNILEEEYGEDIPVHMRPEYTGNLAEQTTDTALINEQATWITRDENPYSTDSNTAIKALKNNIINPIKDKDGNIDYDATNNLNEKIITNHQQEHPLIQLAEQPSSTEIAEELGYEEDLLFSSLGQKPEGKLIEKFELLRDGKVVYGRRVGGKGRRVNREDFTSDEEWEIYQRWNTTGFIQRNLKKELGFNPYNQQELFDNFTNLTDKQRELLTATPEFANYLKNILALDTPTGEQVGEGGVIYPGDRLDIDFPSFKTWEEYRDFAIGAMQKALSKDPLIGYASSIALTQVEKEGKIVRYKLENQFYEKCGLSTPECVLEAQEMYQDWSSNRYSELFDQDPTVKDLVIKYSIGINQVMGELYQPFERSKKEYYDEADMLIERGFTTTGLYKDTFAKMKLNRELTTNNLGLLWDTWKPSGFKQRSAFRKLLANNSEIVDKYNIKDLNIQELDAFRLLFNTKDKKTPEEIIIEVSNSKSKSEKQITQLTTTMKNLLIQYPNGIPAKDMVSINQIMYDAGDLLGARDVKPFGWRGDTGDFMSLERLKQITPASKEYSYRLRQGHKAFFQKHNRYPTMGEILYGEDGIDPKDKVITSLSEDSKKFMAEFFDKTAMSMELERVKNLGYIPSAEKDMGFNDTIRHLIDQSYTMGPLYLGGIITKVSSVLPSWAKLPGKALGQAVQLLGTANIMAQEFTSMIFTEMLEKILEGKPKGYKPTPEDYIAQFEDSDFGGIVEKMIASGVIAGLEKVSVDRLLGAGSGGVRTLASLYKGEGLKFLKNLPKTFWDLELASITEGLTEGMQGWVSDFTIKIGKDIGFLESVGGAKFDREGFNVGKKIGWLLPSTARVFQQTTLETTMAAYDVISTFDINPNSPSAISQWFSTIQSTNAFFTETQNRYKRQIADGTLGKEEGNRAIEELNIIRNAGLKIPPSFYIGSGKHNKRKKLANLLINQAKLQKLIKEVDNKEISEGNGNIVKLAEISAEIVYMVETETAADQYRIMAGNVQDIVNKYGKGRVEIVRAKNAEHVKREKARLEKDGWKIDKNKSNSDYGNIYQRYNPNTKIDEQVIILNDAESIKDGAINTAAHEFLHALIYQTVKNSKGTAIALGNNLLTYIKEINPDALKKGDFKERYEQYKNDTEVTDEDTAEEIITLFSEAVLDGALVMNQKMQHQVGNWFLNIFQSVGLSKIEFNTGKDVYNFIKNYNKNVQKGKLNRAQRALLEKGAEGKLVKRKYGVPTIEREGKRSKKEEEEVSDKKSQKKLFVSPVKQNLGALTTKWQQGAADVDVEIDILPQLEAATISSLKRWGITRPKPLTFDTSNPQVIREIKQEVGQELWSFMENFDETKSSATTYTDNLAKRIGPRLVKILAKPKGQKDITAQELENIAEQETEEAKGKEFKKRKYPSDIAAIEKQTASVRPEILTNIKNSVKQFMASAVGKVKEIGKKGKKIITKLDPSSLAKELKAQNKATKIAVRNAIGKGKQYKDFVTKVINDGYIETIPIAAMKKRFKTVKGFNIEKIGRETLGAGTGIYELSGLNKQALIDFYTKDQSGRRSFIDLLAKGLTIEQFQEVKSDTEFMNDLDFKLKEAKSELTAEEFMNEVERIYDGRTKEFASLDVVKASKKRQRSYQQTAYKTAARTPMSKLVSLMPTTSTVKKKTVNNRLNLTQKEKSYRKLGFINMHYEMGSDLVKNYNYGQKASIYTNEKEATKDLDDPLTQKEIKVLNRMGIPIVVRKGKTYYDTTKANKNNVDEIVTIDGKEYSVLALSIKEQSGKTSYAKWPAKTRRQKLNDPEWREYQQAKLRVLKKIAQLIESDLKANPNNKSWWGTWLNQSSDNTIHPVRALAPIEFLHYRKLPNARMEHTLPANQVGTMIMRMALDGKVDEDFNFIEKDYFQGDISLFNDDLLKTMLDASGKKVNLKTDMPTLFFDIKNPTTWMRYVEKIVWASRTGGINMNEILVWDSKQNKIVTLTEQFGLSLTESEYKYKDGKNTNFGLIRFQNNLLYDVFRGKMTMPEAKARLDVAVKSGVKLAEQIQVEYNGKILAPGVLPTEATPEYAKGVMFNSSETKVNAFKASKKRKGISVFDFDDTIAKTKEKVIVYAPYYGPGKMTEMKMELTPAEFAERAQELEDAGASFDFSQFEKVKGAKKGPLADLALKRQGKFGSKDIFILTARPQIAATGIKKFLDGIGLEIPLENITGLEKGTPQAKVDWILNKTAEGYNDFYFADDSLANVKGVKNILEAVDVKNEVFQAKASKKRNLDTEFNKIVEETTGLKAEAKYSPVRARLEGRKKDKGFFKWFGRQLTITPSAEDFMGLMYDLMGSGKQGNRHAKWIRDNLIDPYNKAEQTILSAKVTVANDFAALKKAFPSLRSSIKGNPLMDQIGVGPYTKSQAMRVYIWNKQGMEIPGLSKRDQNALVAAVEADSELNVFADEIVLIQKDKQYPAPTDNWAGGTIDSDIMSSIDKTFRRQVMTEFDENTKIIFSDKNMNKLEALYGKKWVEALQDSLRRMKSGSNRPVYQGGGARIVNEMLDWLNGSVGAVMFLNMKSGLLQLISNVNFINWGDNNIYQAAKAFASKEYWPTVMKLMNSDYLVNRRDGLKINVNEAELANAAKDGGMKGAIAYLLDKGFIITRIMDSLAIATGGATFYINRRNALLKRQNPDTGKKYTQVEAEAKAFDDFYAISEKTQQSSNPSKISQQQASLFGRVILAFQNVTMQYNRETKKSIRDLYNRRKNPGQTQRESDLGNLSKIIYYTTIQNIIFNGLQQALFAALFDDEEDEKEKNKTAAVANGMLDSLLFGLGFGGAAISTVKNVLLKVMEESDKKSPDYEEAVWEIFNISPVLDSKVRKLRTTAKTFSWNREEIAKRGWSLDNPSYLAISQLISATTNIPIDRVLRKMMNIRMAMDEETRTWQRVALILGWSPWSLGLPYWGLQSTIDQEEKEKEKIKASYKSDIRKMKASGYKKVMAKVLKDYDPKDIIELRSPAGTVVYYAKAGKGKQAKN